VPANPSESANQYTS